MRSTALALAAASVLLALPASGQTLDDVLAKHLAARGGLETIQNAKAVRVAGKMTVGPGMEAPFTMEWKNPGRVRLEFTVQGQTGIQAYDGATAWMHMPFMGKAEPERMPAELASDIQEQADFLAGPLVDWKAKGHQLELVGKSEIEGTEVYHLRLVMGRGDVVDEYLDAETFLTIRQDRKAKRGDREIEVTTTYGNYRESAGLMLPHNLTIKPKDAPATAPGQNLTIDSYDFAAQIDDTRFAFPVKAAEKPAG